MRLLLHCVIGEKHYVGYKCPSLLSVALTTIWDNRLRRPYSSHNKVQRVRHNFARSWYNEIEQLNLGLGRSRFQKYKNPRRKTGIKIIVKSKWWLMISLNLKVHGLPLLPSSLNCNSPFPNNAEGILSSDGLQEFTSTGLRAVMDGQAVMVLPVSMGRIKESPSSNSPF